MSLFPLYDPSKDYAGFMQAVAARDAGDPYDNIADEAVDALWQVVKKANREMLDNYSPLQVCQLFCKTVTADLHLTGSDRLDTSYFRSIVTKKFRTPEDQEAFEQEIQRMHRFCPVAPDARKPDTYNTLRDFAKKVLSGKLLSPLEQRMYDTVKNRY